MNDREELVQILSRARHPMRWEYRSTSSVQEKDYAQADAVINSGWLTSVCAEVWAKFNRDAGYPFDGTLNPYLEHEE